MIRREDVAEFVVNGILVSADLEEFSMYTDYLVDIMHPRRSLQVSNGNIDRHTLYIHSLQSKYTDQLKCCRHFPPLPQIPPAGFQFEDFPIMMLNVNLRDRNPYWSLSDF